MSVPQELVDLIVHNVDDKSSFLSCCFTARSFVQPAQAQLYKNIEFLPPGSGDDSDPCEKFYNSLMSTPHLATLVQELRIVSVVAQSSEDWNTRMGSSLITDSQRTRSLSLILPLLDLKRISLVEDCPSEWVKCSLDWEQFDSPLRSALATIFASPSLESAELRGLRISSPPKLMSLFSEAASLKSLSISRVRLQSLDDPTSWPASGPWKPQLANLFISALRGDHFCEIFLDPRVDLSQVTSLHVASPGYADWKTPISTPPICPRLQKFALMLPQADGIQSMPTTHLASLHLYVMYTADALLQEVSDILIRPMNDCIKTDTRDEYLR
ncbi:hypothetical protein FB45DRAFT_1129541 [Roridomyces roridus]|uniref:Uncharacterized protein n=1 Tax=Roridomyces roridus TaxID=1738132 RepID=A0AAD7B218_9AGAR|nr:hypothetical protein FB45DRAFT_1129541 [Roridomyces roridus]